MQTGQQYFSRYKGIVIQNNDPENVGRVKVFVPQVNMTLLKGWNEEVDTDKFFKFPGANLGSDLGPDVLKRLKEGLPWGEVEQPIFGSGGGGNYWSEVDYGTVEKSVKVSTPVTAPPAPDPNTPPTTTAQPVDASAIDSGQTNTPTIGNSPSTQHGEPQRKEVYTTFYHADEGSDPNTGSGGDRFSNIGKTTGSRDDYYGNREGGTVGGDFRNGGVGSTGTIAVDPRPVSEGGSGIPYGSIVSVLANDGTTRRYVAGDTGSAVVNRTAARRNGSTAPVIDIHLPRNEWDKTIAEGTQTVIVYPYTGDKPFTRLSNAEKEEFYNLPEELEDVEEEPTPEGTPQEASGVTLPSNSDDADASLFPDSDSGMENAAANPIIPPVVKQEEDIGADATASYSKSDTSGPDVGGNNILNPTKTMHQSGTVNGDATATRGTNTTTPNTTPAMRSPQGNQPNGIVSIPEVGNHVWVQFENGDPSSPVITGVIVSKESHLLNNSASNTANV